MKLVARGHGVRNGVAETLGAYEVKKKIDLPDNFDELDEELSAEEYELYADQVVDQATAAETIPELEGGNYDPDESGATGAKCRTIRQ